MSDIPDSGKTAVFSVEEQREISERIEEASARETLSPPGFPGRGEAAKRSVFPLLVNAAALLVLAAGFFTLTGFHRIKTVEIQGTGAVLGVTERALIREIRRETGEKLKEKEEAIEAMNARIAGIEEELDRLDSLEALTDEQQETMAELRRRQEEFRSGLGTLMAERSQILADSMQREAALYARLEEQQGTMESISEQSRAEIKAAGDELARLSGEQEKAVLIDRQLSGYYAVVEQRIQEGHYREAMETLAALREFLNTPSFQAIPRFQARRSSDLAAANAISLTVAEALRAGGASAVIAATAPAGSAAASETAATAETEAALRRQLAEQSAALAVQEEALAELRKNHGDLQSRNTASQQTLAERDRQVESLQAQNTANLQRIETLQRTISNINAALGDQ